MELSLSKNVTGVLFNIGSVDQCQVDGKNLRKATLVDQTGNIQITFFGDICVGVEEKQCYSITNACVKISLSAVIEKYSDD